MHSYLAVLARGLIFSNDLLIPSDPTSKPLLLAYAISTKISHANSFISILMKHGPRYEKTCRGSSMLKPACAIL